MSVDTLICFAVREEAKFFTAPPNVTVIVTGMGRENALKAIEKAVAKQRPGRVLTCGFAGGLSPLLEPESIVFDEDETLGLSARALGDGAKKVKFVCADRVAVTVEDKRRLWKATGGDAVEMESETIRRHCAKQGIPSGTFRVISDAAHEPLPLDFNTLMNSEQKIDFKRLGFTLLRNPRKIAELLAFQQKTIDAAKKLGGFLQRLKPWEAG